MGLRFLVCFLLLAVFSAPAARAQSNVNLQSIRLLKSYSLLLPPSVYFTCSNTSINVDLPTVNEVNKNVTFTGQEPWQPLMQLSPGQCQTCAIIQQLMVLGTPTIAKWTTCYSNFSGGATPGVLQYTAPGALSIVMQCNGCAGIESPADSTPEAPATGGSTPAGSTSGSSDANLQFTPGEPGADSKSKITNIGIGLLVAGLVIIAVTLTLYFVLKPKHEQAQVAAAAAAAEAEQSKLTAPAYSSSVSAASIV